MKCLIIAANLESEIRELIQPDDYSFIICADSSFVHAIEENIRIDLIIGDFDHESFCEAQLPKDVEVIRLPSVKDDTDTQYCIKEALSRGYNDIDIVGGTGGRLDHTIANIQSLAYACKRNAAAKLIDKNNEIIVIDKDISIKKGKKYFSVFSLTDYSIVNIKGAFYSGENIKLTNTFPLGVSNEVTCEKADIEVLSGTLVLAISED